MRRRAGGDADGECAREAEGERRVPHEPEPGVDECVVQAVHGVTLWSSAQSCGQLRVALVTVAASSYQSEGTQAKSAPVTTPSAPTVSSGVRTAATRRAVDADRRRVRTGATPAEGDVDGAGLWCSHARDGSAHGWARAPYRCPLRESSPCRRVTDTMTTLRIRDAARYLGVSDDTVRRLVDAGTLPRSEDPSGRTVVEGRDLAAYVRGRDAGSTTRPVSAARRGTASSASSPTWSSRGWSPRWSCRPARTAWCP